MNSLKLDIEPFESDHDDRKNKFKDENSHNRQGVLGIDQSPSKSKTIKTMSLGRELRKKQFKDFPKPLSAEDTMNLIVESFLEGDEGYCLDPDHVILPNFEEARHSSKPNGLIQAYAANTNQGVFRNYNEDRVSIILNITKPSFKQIENWPTWSFFAVYDGHGGASCADFLRDNLHQFIVKQTSFPSDPVTAIRDGFAEAESFFLEIVENAADEAMKEAGETNFEGFVDNSGSWAVVILIIDRTVYMANVGDSRTIMSANGGRNAYSLSKDHKPNEEGEAFRILNNGGKIYQTQTMVPKLDGSGNECILGPHRVFPGRLSVSRSFGDIEAKLPKYGGNMKVIVADPEIRVFEITDNLDFIILAWDGIYDKLSNKEILQIVWEGVIDSKSKDPHQQWGIAVDRILKTSVAKKTMDNITVVFIAFSNFEECQKTLNPYYIDEEHIEEEQFPEKCVSDFEYIQGRCETPHYLKPKPKGSRIKYEPPTIITSNPEELAMLPPQVPQNFNMQSSESEPSHNELNEENFHENMIAEQPYMQTNFKGNIVRMNSNLNLYTKFF